MQGSPLLWYGPTTRIGFVVAPRSERVVHCIGNPSGSHYNASLCRGICLGKKNHMYRGWIRIHRRLEDTPLWKSETFTKGQAWVDLIILARYDKGEMIIKNGEVISLSRGDVGVSALGLADRWKWSRGKVRRFIRYLIEREMVHQKMVGNRLVIQICNYDTYQSDTVNHTPNGTVNGHQTVHQTDTNKKVKKVKNDKKKIIHSDIISDHTGDRELTEAINDFLEMRKKIRSPMTNKALSLLLGKLNKMSPEPKGQIDLLETAILNNWKSVYPPKQSYTAQTSNNQFLDASIEGRFDGE